LYKITRKEEVVKGIGKGERLTGSSEFCKIKNKK
jgi:hypothetical protein